MLRIDFDSVAGDVELPDVTLAIDQVIETIDKLAPTEVLAVINEKGLEFTVSRENEDDYWEVDSVTKSKDGHTNSSIKA
jgi:hypothetical protein